MNRLPTVVVMARAACPGSTKTRLQPLLGATGCARLQHALIVHTAATALRVAPTSLVVAVDPPDAVTEVAATVGPAVAVVAQEGSHLGSRMSAAVAHAAATRPGPVVLIGTDVPSLTSGLIVAAVRLLEAGHDVVFGPALDGGYYLIALSHPAREVFEIDPASWGGPCVLERSVAAARAAGLTVAFLPKLRDLDIPADARALAAEGALPPAIHAILSSAIEKSLEPR